MAGKKPPYFKLHVFDFLADPDVLLMTPEERSGRPYRRASCPDANAALVYSGVPNAGEPVFMSTLLVKLP